MLDIHSHILPGVDDGARDVESSIALLSMMKEQGITKVIATPHFDAMHQSMDDFERVVFNSCATLKQAMQGLDLPQVAVGSEIFYFAGIGKSSGIRSISLCGSDYLLLELPSYRITDSILRDIRDINDRLCLMPIIAHIERYSCERGFKKLLELVANGEAYAQINAQSLLESPYKKLARKLIKSGYISFIATDAHSVEHRPPRMAEALQAVENDIGRSYMERLVRNSQRFSEDIFKPI